MNTMTVVLKQFVLVLAGLSLLILSGCAGKITADLELNKGFEPAAEVNENESLVYVIRQSSMLGAARGIYVGFNQYITTNLLSGEYCHFIVNDGINTLNLEQLTPFGFKRIDGQKGETIFYYFEMTSGKFEELDKDTGITAVMKSKKSKGIRPKDNPGYVTAIINPANVGLYLMEETDILLQPDEESAIITFIRPQAWGKEMGFGIWGEKDFLGNLKGESYFQIKVSPGKHNFIGKSEHFSVLEADVEAGKNYYVQVAASMGWSQAHVRLLPVDAKISDIELQKWLSGSTLVKVSAQAADELVQNRLALAQPLIKEALRKVTTKEAEARTLNKNSGR